MLTYTPGIFMSIEDLKYNVDDPKWCAITYFLLRNFCSASAIIFLLFANDFIERHDLICFVFARSMKRSSLTCCDERISILSRAEWERFSVQIWVVGYLGSILTRFTISTNVVVDVWLLLKAADMRRIE